MMNGPQAKHVVFRALDDLHLALVLLMVDPTRRWGGRPRGRRARSAPASQRDRGMSIAGLRPKKPTGLMAKLCHATGITGQSSGRGT